MSGFASLLPASFVLESWTTMSDALSWSGVHEYHFKHCVAALGESGVPDMVAVAALEQGGSLCGRLCARHH